MGTRFLDYATLLYYSLSRLGQLANPQLRLVWLRQIKIAGIEALPVIVLLGMVSGGLLVTRISTLMGSSNELAIRLLLWFLLFEFAPLLTALVIVSRSSGSMASELALMRIHHEFAALERLRIPPADFALLPRIAGVAVAVPAATVIFQGVSLLSGITIDALVQHLPIPDQLDRYLELAEPSLLLVGILKGFCFGLAVSSIACFQGTHCEMSPLGVPRSAMAAVGQGLIYVFLIDALFVAGYYLL